MPRNQEDEEYGEENDDDVNVVLQYFENYGEEDALLEDCEMDTGMYAVEVVDQNYG
jgi:hypothetical protein